MNEDQHPYKGDDVTRNFYEMHFTGYKRKKVVVKRLNNYSFDRESFALDDILREVKTHAKKNKRRKK